MSWQTISRPNKNAAILLFVAVSLLAGWAAPKNARGANLKFEISFSGSVHQEPVTGRVFVMISRKDSPEPRFQVGSWGDAPPFFAKDVSRLQPGQAAVIDASDLGYPLRSLRDLPAGDYYVQALLNIYTEFHRADGHVIWTHMDHWEGQQFNRSPGNIYSRVEQIHLDPATDQVVKLSLTRMIPPVKMPSDTQWVKHIKIESSLLSRFWGHPIFLGATVLLPKGYASHPQAEYPVIYVQGHFSLKAPFGFTTHEGSEEYKFYEAWRSDDFPRLIAVTFEHPTPYFDDSYAVNSANNGPYGDAIMTELIPYIEGHFRVIRKPCARLLTGGSTGGWESLALQLYHPKFFGGTWTFYPDPVDFRRYDLVNIYDDDNAFIEPGHEWIFPERYIMRRPDGQPEVTVREFSQLEAALGTHGRSGQQLEAWEAVFGPVGADGYPKPLWNKLTGTIDHGVADYMRDHGYDLRDYLAARWQSIGPDLVGKLHFYVGDMDSYYLNLAVYLFQDFLASTQNPHYSGSFDYGRPMKGHGWQPMSNADLVRMMAKYIAQHSCGNREQGTGNRLKSRPWRRVTDSDTLCYHRKQASPEAFMKVGVHTSIAGGLENAAHHAEEIGCDTFQMFSANPRGWRATALTPEACVKFRSAREKYRLAPVVVHDNYLINLASADSLIRERSIAAFRGELVRATQLGADYLVTHPGSSKGTTVSRAIANCIESLKKAGGGLHLDGLTILIENTAGQGSAIGRTFEEVASIVEGAARVLPTGACIDTAHCFAAGYPIHTAEGLGKMLLQLDVSVGLEKVRVIHANDSKTRFDSHADRHEHIGKGYIGAAAFGRIVRHPKLRKIPFICETPVDRPGDDKRNIRMMRKLAEEKLETRN